jgi:putative peptidoglycan lipid II flippase
MSTDPALPVHTKSSFTKAVGVVSGATFLSRILGYIRDMLIADLFGARASADAFFVAFRIPNLLRRLTAEGALTAAFVPVFTELYTTEGRQRAFSLTANILSIMAVLLTVVVALGVIFAEQVVWAVAPGFTDDPALFDLTVTLTRITMPYLLFISLAAVFMGALNATNTYFVPAVAPAFMNIAIISCALLLYDSFAEPTYALAVGVIAGGMLQLVVQIPILMSKGFRPRFTFDLTDKATRKIGLLVAPGILGIAVAEINIFIDTLLASLLPEGSISFLYYGNRITQFPLGIFGVAIGIAALPSMSAVMANGGKEKLGEMVSYAFRLSMFISIPASVGLIAAAAPIMNVLFERGEFNETARYGSAIALIYYSIGIWAFAGVKALVSAFYAMKDTATPVKIAAVSMVVNIVLNMLLMGPLQHGGLALATTLSSSLNALLLLWMLHRRLGNIEGRIIIGSIVRMLFASGLMGVATYFYLDTCYQYDAPGFWRMIHLGIAISGGAVLYFVVAYSIGSREAKTFYVKIKQRLHRPASQKP